MEKTAELIGFWKTKKNWNKGVQISKSLFKLQIGTEHSKEHQQLHDIEVLNFKF